MIRHPGLVTVSAAGRGDRMRRGMQELSFPENLPKPLLPTGLGETLVGRIVRQAMAVGHVEVYANYDTIRSIGEHEDLPQDVSLLVNRNIYGPLGPLYLDLLRYRERASMAAADFWADFRWSDLLEFHDRQPTPVTVMVGRSVPAAQGAVFDVAPDGVVRSWERVARTTPTDLINIGAYVADPDIAVMDAVRGLKSHKEDEFNDAMIAAGLMSAYVLEEMAFNVNDAGVYREMVRYTAGRKQV